MAEVRITTARGEMPAYLATPADGGPWPGVIVVHDALGMSRDLRNEADWLASAGYLAVAPDLYYWGRRITCMVAFIREVRAMDKRALGDTDRAVHLGAWIALSWPAIGTLNPSTTWG